MPRASHGPSDHGSNALLDLESSICRLILAGVAEFTENAPGGAPERLLINFLRGNQDPPADSRPEASCYGSLHDHSAAWLALVLDCLTEEGYLDRPAETRTRYRLSPPGQRFVEGRERLDRPFLPRPARLGADPAMETRLRKLRHKLSTEEGRPAFSIFDNRTLAWLAYYKPRNLSELVDAPGFGPRRIEQYGRKIVSLIRRSR